MKKMSKRLLSTMLALTLVFALFAISPIMASAFWGTQLRDLINNFDPGNGGPGTGQLTATLSAENTVVTVTGDVEGATKTLSLNINSGVTVVWKADYSGSVIVAMIDLSGGDGIFEVAGGSIIQTGKGHGIYGGTTVRVTGGKVSCMSPDEYYFTVASVTVEVSGGIVENTGESRAIVSNDVKISGGMVCSTGEFSIYANTFESVTGISGGFVFGTGTNISGAGYDSSIRTYPDHHPTIGGSAVVCAWDMGGGGMVYIEGTSHYLTVTPAGASVKWATEGSQSGVKYEYGGNKGFYPIRNVTVNAAGEPNLGSFGSGFVGPGITVVVPFDPGQLTPNPVSITKHPANSTVAEGKSSSFSISASGMGLAYQWQGKSSSDAEWADLTSGSRYSAVTTPTLNITNTPGTFNGYMYQCVVTGMLGSATTITAFLTVKPASPADLAASATLGGVTLTWSNRSFVATDLCIYRKESGGEWVELTSSLPADSLTYKDTTAQEGKDYTYRMCAYNANSLLYSYFSFEASATMPVAPGIAPSISGGYVGATPPEGYEAFETVPYYISGSPEPTVTMTTDCVAITWDDSEKILKIAAGLEVGTYEARITASNGVEPDATYVFTVTVIKAEDEDEGAVPSGGSMYSFAKKNTYIPGMFSDVDENQWYGYDHERSVANAYEYGLMAGMGSGLFNPAGNMSISQAVTIAVRVHDIYSGGSGEFVQGEPWYQVYVDYAVANGIIKANDFTDYGRAATRAEMAYIFSRSLPEEEFPVQNTVNSLPDVTGATPYRNEIFMLYKAGILSGNNAQGTFYPGNNISRAEAAAIISRVVIPGERQSGKTFG